MHEPLVKDEARAGRNLDQMDTQPGEPREVAQGFVDPSCVGVQEMSLVVSGQCLDFAALDDVSVHLRNH